MRDICSAHTYHERKSTKQQEDTFLATLDSRSEEITSENELVISKADFKLNLVQFPNQDFFSTIRNKLFWGSDRRN